jgi:large subunit ribosomal protein L6
MSRIGRNPITIPAGVEVKIGSDNHVVVKGPKGELSRTLPQSMLIEIEGNVATVKRPTDNKEHRSLHGLTRTLLFNMVTGVSTGYAKTLEIAGVGYRAAKTGSKLALTMGFSHPVELEPPQGISIEVPAPNRIIVSGIDKERVGAIAAEIRAFRKPEPYKGKGIKYEGEKIRRKAGKAGGKGKK